MISFICGAIKLSIFFVTLLLSLLVIFILFDTYVVVKSSVLDGSVAELSPSSNNGYDYSSLKRINDDVIGWIRIFDTNIDYPILQGKDNEYYLSRNIYKEFATAGSIFLDYRNDYYSDNFMIIYGHRMSYGNMLTDVTKYKNRNYFNSHKEGEIIFENDSHEARVVAYLMISAKTYDVYGLKDSAVSFIKDHALYREPFVNSGRFVLLSTCDRIEKTKRNVVLLEIL